MSKNMVIGGVIVIIIVAFGIWYFTSTDDIISMNNQSATSTGSVTTNTTASTTTTNPNTFRSIFSQTGNHQCSYEQVDSSSRSSSVIYIADGKMRGEFRTTTGSGSSANLMIYNGGYLYSWKEGATVGTKSSIKSLSELPQVIPVDLGSGAILGVSSDNVSWDCHDWAKDAKQFVIPTYVKFSLK